MAIVFEGTLTARDCKRHLPHAFHIPPGAAGVALKLSFTPFRVHHLQNMITLTLFDAAGFRGAGHRGGDTHVVEIGLASATPGYHPGPLPPGEWIAQVDTHMIMPGAPVRYRLEVSISLADAPLPAPPERPARRLPQRGPGWYRGDLHSHTNHSDANQRTVADLVQMAREAQLDFLFLTDHNTTSSLAEVEALGDENLLTAGGLELTTFWGHALYLGTRAWVDWRIRPGDHAIERIAATADADGHVFVIAHPQSIGDPYCTGCNWRYGEMMPGNARLVEIWNGPWNGDLNNEPALALWYDWLNQGLRLVGTAGSDTHGPGDYAKRPGFNVIYADQLSEAALLNGLRAGHLYLSSGPQVVFRARTPQGATAISGDTLTQPALFTCRWNACPPDAEVRVIVNGRLQNRQVAGVQGELAWNLAPTDADWTLVEIRAADGELLAITNPIFLTHTNAND